MQSATDLADFSLAYVVSGAEASSDDGVEPAQPCSAANDAINNKLRGVDFMFFLY